MSEIPSWIRQDYYDQLYFADKEGKCYLVPGEKGWKVEHWGYRNPNGEFFGASAIAKAWKKMFWKYPEIIATENVAPKLPTFYMLDCGCGRGTFLAYARDEGMQAIGFDYSDWAVNHPYPRCKKEWLHNWDATKLWPLSNKDWDLVVALDFYEHLYTDDIDFVIDEMFRVAKKWIFLQIATVDGVREKGYILKKGEPVPNELQANVVAGPVTVQTAQFWYDKLDDEDFIPRRDLVQWFTALVPNEIIRNWLANTIIVLERVK